MKNRWIDILILVIFSVCAINILEASADPIINWNISPRLWYADWDAGDSDDSSLMCGVGASISFKKFGLGLSFLTGEFDHAYDEGKMSSDRFDSDLYLSYKILEPYVSLSAGYKLITYEFQFKYDLLDEDIKADADVTGFGLGCAGAIPVKDIFYFYYITSILPFMEAEMEFSYLGEKYKEDEDIFSYNIELGAGYSINEKISVSLGWKHQVFDWDDSDDETVSGFTTMANFNF